MIVKVPATSANLGPGFDSLGLALDLQNTFSITPASLTSIHISGQGQDRPKMRIDNAFVRIFNEVLQKNDYPLRHFKFSFYNQIPISRGLGSSSATIISAIFSAYQIMQKPIDKQEILNLALCYENHPDNITPALCGGFNVAMLEEDKVLSHTAFIPDEIKAVVVIPNTTISTRFSRKTLPKKYTAKDCVFNLSHSSLLTAAFMSHKWELLRFASKDRMHQVMRMKSLPILFSVQKCAIENGALLSTLSGSGSSFLNICYRDDSSKLARILADKFPRLKVVELGFDNAGATLIES